MAHAHNGDLVEVVLFCACMLDEGASTFPRLLTWCVGEYDVLSTEQTYAVVANHRKDCALTRDLFAKAEG